MKQTILLVEDDDQIAYLMQYILEQDGYQVHRAADGKAAQAIIAALAPPALVTLDINLPHLQGDELILQIKSTPGWDAVPIVMVTARPKDKDLPWAIKSGAQAYLMKPFKPEELRDCVRRLVAKKPAG
jgi:DNA-binding response OmpR family regulator